MTKHSVEQASVVRTAEGPRSLDWLLDELRIQRQSGRRIVTTNGCFDVLHSGHVAFLREARGDNDLLIVLLNTDDSVTRLKGKDRPVVSQEDRAAVLLGLRPVEYVVLFDELTPEVLLDRIRPHAHCKAGDYTVEQLPEAQVVQSYGGDVCILPFRQGYSSSDIIERIIAGRPAAESPTVTTQLGSSDAVCRVLLGGSEVLRETARRLEGSMSAVAHRMAQAIRDGNKLLSCGNGGSAAEAQHFAAEMVGRYRRERKAWPAVALTADTSVLTAVGNDYGFDRTFARQVEALGRPGDVLLAISTSGSSPNVLHAVRAAQQLDLWTIGLTGESASPLAEIADHCLQVPATDTPLIQQAHIAIVHALSEMVESELEGPG